MKIDNKKFYLCCANCGIGSVEALRKAGLNLWLLSSINKGRNVRSKTLAKLAAALNVAPKDLLKEE